MPSEQKQLKQHFMEIIKKQPRSIRAKVAEEAIEQEDIKTFFSDLLQHGCQSGMINSLIYYTDTHQFYDAHYSEIEELRYELEESIGQPLQPQGDLKNWFAWMAFEETARKMAAELELIN